MCHMDCIKPGFQGPPLSCGCSLIHRWRVQKGVPPEPKLAPLQKGREIQSATPDGLQENLEGEMAN